MSHPEFVAPPLPFVAWGVLFHTLGACLGFRVTTSVPLLGAGTAAVLVRLLFSLATFITMLNHVYHLVGMLGVSLEVQEKVFISGVLVLLPSQYCMCRCFFLALPRKQAVLLTALNIFTGAIWPVLVKAGSGLPDEQPVSVLGTPEFMQEHGWRFVAQHIATEVGITIVTIITYLQMAPVLAGKTHKA